ncbi:MAG: ATP-dependent sacrificial sulfur transferase LarE [Actinomycetota bacterium]|nr:ATP-dependent sacrificial sulfur transferase LarE [Actinomycetota bacterium]
MDSFLDQNIGSKDKIFKSKCDRLQKIIREMGSVAVAFSGGVDSTFLLRICEHTLGENVVAITASSEIIPPKEVEEAKKLAMGLDVEHIVITLNALENKDFVANSEERCYFCKHDLYLRFNDIALQKGILHLIDGTNYDDFDDFRPGQRAAQELGVRSPLAEARLTKEDIRFLSKYLSLPTWNKSPMACLATRIPYGQRITPERINLIHTAESVIHELGINQVRVRLHDERTARIEVAKTDIQLLFELRSWILDRFKRLGFDYITVDLEGYRQGSMNLPLPTEEKKCV